MTPHEPKANSKGAKRPIPLKKRTESDLTKRAEELGNKLWTQLTRQMKFIGIITPETPNKVRLWIVDEIAQALREYAEERCQQLIDGYDETKAIKQAYNEGAENAELKADHEIDTRTIAMLEAKVVGYEKALRDIFQVTNDFTRDGKYLGDLKMIWIYEKIKQALSEGGEK